MQTAFPLFQRNLASVSKLHEFRNWHSWSLTHVSLVKQIVRLSADREWLRAIVGCQIWAPWCTNILTPSRDCILTNIYNSVQVRRIWSLASSAAISAACQHMANSVRLSAKLCDPRSLSDSGRTVHGRWISYTRRARRSLGARRSRIRDRFPRPVQRRRERGRRGHRRVHREVQIS